MSKRSMRWMAAMTTGLMISLVTGVAAQAEPSGAPRAESSAAPAAESVAPSLEPAAALAPPEVEGLEWGETQVRTGAQIEADTDERAQAEWAALLEGTGASYEQASQLFAQAVDPESGEMVGAYSAIRIADADETQLREAVLAVLRMGDEDDAYLFEETEIGGKPVTVIMSSDDQQAIIYVSGDTTHLMDMPNEALDLVLAALP